jgi:hypothetical protein
MTKEKIIEIWEELARVFNETPNEGSLKNTNGYCYYLKYFYKMKGSEIREFFIKSRVTAKEIGEPLEYAAEVYWKVFACEAQSFIQLYCNNGELPKNSLKKRAKFAAKKAEELKELWGI